MIPASPLTEPKVVDCVFCEGVILEIRDDVLRMVGFIDLETAADGKPERRIVVRAAMPTIIARALIRDLRKSLARGGN
jgi:hypothetical protein